MEGEEYNTTFVQKSGVNSIFQSTITTHLKLVYREWEKERGRIVFGEGN